LFSRKFSEVVDINPMLLLTKIGANGCTNFDKKEKWLKVTMGTQFPEKYILGLIEFFLFIHHAWVHSWSKFCGQWVHSLRDIKNSFFCSVYGKMTISFINASYKNLSV